MCRLFGLHAGHRAVSATFWLLDAPDSLSEQSHRNPDGAGVGRFDGSHPPVVDKQPLAAWRDPAFARAARTLRGVTFVAHVRYASTGGLTAANTHPFEQDGRLFAHNGVVEGLPALDARLDELGVGALVRGNTDSERVFALITAEARKHAGDLQAAVTAAVRWVADAVPVYSLNLILLTATDLLALRYPDTNGLYVLERPAGGAQGNRHLDAATSRIHARSSDLASRASVVIASEPMDDDAWRLLDAGELLHVGADLSVRRSLPLPNAPKHALSLRDLNPAAAGSQQPTTAP